MKILITGAAGFLASDLIPILLDQGHEIIGIDNFSKYPRKKTPSCIEIIEGDARNTNLLEQTLKGRDCLIPMAAMVGGIDYFHRNPFSIISYNDSLAQAAFAAAINCKISRFLLISSSMVFENSSSDNMMESSIVNSAPPSSSYGFQKLNLERYAEYAWNELALPCEIIRPFNAVGLGELQDIESAWKNIKAGSPTQLHVIPDLILKCLLENQKLKIYGDGEQIRCFTSAKDIARGISSILDRDFDQLRYYHLSSNTPTKISDLAAMIWKMVRPDEVMSLENLPRYKWDVKVRIPETQKTMQLLNFNPNSDLSKMIQDVYQEIQMKISK